MKKSALVIISFIFGLTISFGFAQTTSFPDVKPSDWFYQYVMNIKSWGIINGTGAGTFDPSGTINRAQFSKMISLYDERVDEKIAQIQPDTTTQSSRPYSIMSLREFGKEPNKCPSGWKEMDYGISWEESGNAGRTRTCYTSQACSVAHLEKFNKEPKNCPSGWKEANYGIRWISGGHNKYGRTCYVCN